MKRLLRYGNWLLVIVSILTAVMASLYLILLLAFGQGRSRVIYWLAFSSHFDDPMTFIFGVTLAVRGAFVVLTITARLLHVSVENSRRGAQAVLLVMLVPVIFYIGSFIISISDFDGWKQVDTGSLNKHIYHLLVYSYDWARGDGFYTIYECDRLDLFCDELNAPGIYGSTANAGKARLLVDPATNTVSLEINGIASYTYHQQQ